MRDFIIYVIVMGVILPAGLLTFFGVLLAGFVNLAAALGG